MSQMHLGAFSLTHLEQHCARRTDTQELDGFGARDCRTGRAMSHLVHTEKSLLVQRVIRRVSHLQALGTSLRDPRQFLILVYYIHQPI